MKLFTGPISAFGVKAEMAAIEKDLLVEVELVPFSIAEGYTPKAPEVLRANPKGQVPVLLDDDLSLFDSTQIFEYFEDLRPSPALWPSEAKARARARLAELEVDEVFFPLVTRLFPANRAGVDEADIAAIQEAIATHYARWNAQLSDGRDYLLGPLTYADLALLPCQFLAEALGAGLQPTHAHLHAWRKRMLARPSARPIGRAFEYVKALGLELDAFRDVGPR